MLFQPSPGDLSQRSSISCKHLEPLDEVLARGDGAGIILVENRQGHRRIHPAVHRRARGTGVPLGPGVRRGETAGRDQAVAREAEEIHVTAVSNHPLVFKAMVVSCLVHDLEMLSSSGKS